MDLSGKFVSVTWFLSRDNKNLEQQTTGCKRADELQLSSAQADTSFIRPTLPKHGSRPVPKESS